jgi:phospholipase/lecithinase/hemolysin
MFNQIHVFGESLSDSGNVFTVSTAASQLLPSITPTPPSPPNFEGRFADGLIWVDQIALDLNLNLLPATTLSVGLPIVAAPTGEITINSLFNGATTTESVNFAFGGAQTGQNAAGEFGEAIPGVLRQVDWYLEDLALTGTAANPDALYIIWAGGNDYQTVANPDPQQSVNNLVTAVERLYNAGARNIVLPNLPDVGKTPRALSSAAPIASEPLTAVTNIHNDLLTTAWSQLQQSLPELTLIPLDTNSLFDQILDFPAAFGFTNTTEPCLDPITLMPCDTPETHVFWDVIHSTTATHQILTDYAIAGINWYLEPIIFTLLTENDDNITLADSQTLDQLVVGLAGNDTIVGTVNNDRIYGNQDADILVGEAGDDALRGGKGNDFLLGGPGDDILIGDLGQADQIFGDVLSGGDGNDVFMLQGNNTVADIVIDFNPVEDRIGLTDNLPFEALTLTPFNNFSIPTTLQSHSLISLAEIDPDADGLLSGTTINGNEQTIALVLNRTPEELFGRFLEFPNP